MFTSDVSKTMHLSYMYTYERNVTWSFCVYF